MFVCATAVLSYYTPSTSYFERHRRGRKTTDDRCRRKKQILHALNEAEKRTLFFENINDRVVGCMGQNAKQRSISKVQLAPARPDAGQELGQTRDRLREKRACSSKRMSYIQTGTETQNFCTFIAQIELQHFITPAQCRRHQEIPRSCLLR